MRLLTGGGALKSRNDKPAILEGSRGDIARLAIGFTKGCDANPDDTCTGEHIAPRADTESLDDAMAADDRDATERADAAGDAEEGCSECCKAAWVLSLIRSFPSRPKISGSPAEDVPDGDRVCAAAVLENS